MKYVLFLERQITDNKFDRMFINDFTNWIDFAVAYTGLKETLTKMGLKVDIHFTEDKEFTRVNVVIYK